MALKTTFTRFVRAAAQLVPDLAWVNIALAASLWIAADQVWNPIVESEFFSMAPSVNLAALVVLTWRGIHRIQARYLGLYDQLNLAIASSILTAFAAVRYSFPESINNLGFLLLFGFNVFAGLTATRVAMRMWNWRISPLNSKRTGERKVRTLIVGAGDAGEFVLRELGRANERNRIVMGFVDDDPAKRNLIIQGVRVLGNVAEIPMLTDNLNIDEILICIPSAQGDTMRRISDICIKTNVRVRTLPSVAGLLNGHWNTAKNLREIDVEDLLRREPAEVDPNVVASITTGESVLVTGGGGSIGSELSRQVARLSPARLTILGKGENSLYEIEQELVQTSALAPSCVVADVRNQDSMEYAFQKFRPTVVFHAAAHKHVPLMQSNPIEAIRNNVFGTKCAVTTSIKHGVNRFVLISTDKAVNPTSVMGATKRVAEMIVGAYANTSDTKFAVVRFGNVLGSRGSLIPLLKNQIARGGPVRITHPDMTRYFMTIPEAVQLILQAGAQGDRGEVFILDMGDPVKIIDLAYDLIRLHGLVPHEDIEVKFVGPRPGEKLHEELTYGKEELVPTQHPKINMAHTSPVDLPWLLSELEQLSELCEQGDQDAAQQFLMELAWGKHNLMPDSWDKLRAA